MDDYIPLDTAAPAEGSSKPRKERKERVKCVESTGLYAAESFS